MLRRRPMSLGAAASEACFEADDDVLVAAVLDAAKIPFVGFVASVAVVPRALLRRPLPSLLDDSTLLASVVIASSEERFLVLRRRIPLVSSGASFADDGSSLTKEALSSVGLSSSTAAAAAAVGTDNRRGFRRRRIEGLLSREVEHGTGSFCKPLADDTLGLIANGEESQSLAFCSLFAFDVFSTFAGFDSSSGMAEFVRVNCKSCTFFPIDVFPLYAMPVEIKSLELMPEDALPLE